MAHPYTGRREEARARLGRKGKALLEKLDPDRKRETKKKAIESSSKAVLDPQRIDLAIARTSSVNKNYWKRA